MDRHHVNIAPQGQTSVNDAPTEPMREITENELDEYREQDRFLPIANVARIMKRCLPGNAKISKDAKECVQECVSEFISFITSEAQEHCMTEKRKTINGEDILQAMESLGFENYCPAVGIYLAKYRELLKAQPSSKSSKRKTHEEDADVSMMGQTVESDEGASVENITDQESDSGDVS